MSNGDFFRSFISSIQRPLKVSIFRNMKSETFTQKIRYFSRNPKMSWTMMHITTKGNFREQGHSPWGVFSDGGKCSHNRFVWGFSIGRFLFPRDPPGRLESRALVWSQRSGRILNDPVTNRLRTTCIYVCWKVGYRFVSLFVRQRPWNVTGPDTPLWNIQLYKS